MQMRIYKIIAEEVILVLFLASFLLVNDNTQLKVENAEQAKIIDTFIPDNILTHSAYDSEQEEIRNEIFYGELELLAQLIQAEAGNQDELGKRYVADVVLNRVDSDDFPDSIEEVIFQTDPVQFTCTVDGNFEKAGWTVTEECYKIALEEYQKRQDSTILYFSSKGYNSAIPEFKYGNHYFSR